MVKEMALRYNLNFSNTMNPMEPNCISGAKNWLPQSVPNRLDQKLVFTTVYRLLMKTFTKKKAGANI